MAIEVGPGVDSGVEKPPDTKWLAPGKMFDVPATAVMAWVSEHNGGVVSVDSKDE